MAKGLQPVLTHPLRSGQDLFVPGRSVLMIDARNTYAGLHVLNADIDYRNLRELFFGDMPLVRALVYALTTDGEYSNMRPFLDWLAYNGYEVREKHGRAFVDANGRHSLRGRVSLEMAVDALEMAPTMDQLILFSGDGNLAPLVKALQRQGVRVTAVSLLTSNPPMIAAELRRQVDRFLDLRDLMPFVGRPRPSRDRSSAVSWQAASIGRV